MSDSVKLCLIAARGRNGVIGADGKLPWRLKEDLAFFKRITGSSPLLMGRKTWESLKIRPLPGRENIVLTQDWTYDAPGARVYSNISAATHSARAIARRAGLERAFVIGGQSIYAAAMPLADEIFLTEVDAEPEGDARFPDFDETDWEEVDRDYFSENTGNDHAFYIRHLVSRLSARATKRSA